MGFANAWEFAGCILRSMGSRLSASITPHRPRTIAVNSQSIVASPAGPSTPHSFSNGNFFFAAVPRHQQIGHVHACDQQHKPDGRQQHQQRWPQARHRLSFSVVAAVAASWHPRSFRIARDRRINGLQFRLRLRQCATRAQFPNTPRYPAPVRICSGRRLVFSSTRGSQTSGSGYCTGKRNVAGKIPTTVTFFPSSVTVRREIKSSPPKWLCQNPS